VLLSNSVHPWAHATPVDAVPLVRAATADAAMDLLATAARRERRGDRPAFHHHHSHCDITGVELTPPPPVACAVLPNAAGPRGLLSTSVVGLSAATPSPLYDATRPLQLQQYVVCAGDTVGRLAGQRGMSVAEVQALNPTIDVDVIDVGQRLWLVDPPRLAERPVEAYTVKQDDRLPVLAYRHDMTMGDVARLNPTLGENAVTAAVGTMLLLHPSLTDHGGLVPSGLGYVATESPPWIPLSVSDPTGDAADATTGEAREAAAVARRSSGSAAVSSAPVIQDDATLDVVDAGSGSESEDEDEDSGVDDDGTHVYQAPSGPAAGIPALLSGDSAAEVVRAPMCAGGQAQYWHRFCEPKRRAGPHGHERRATSNATPTATNRARWLQLVVAAGVAVAALVSRRLD
jgi:LysM repeat protein